MKRNKTRVLSRALIHIKKLYGVEAMISIILLLQNSSLSNGLSSFYVCAGYNLTEEILHTLCGWGVLNIESEKYRLSEEYR